MQDAQSGLEPVAQFHQFQQHRFQRRPLLFGHCVAGAIQFVAELAVTGLQGFKHCPEFVERGFDLARFQPDFVFQRDQFGK